jgi:hypothetical protein
MTALRGAVSTSTRHFQLTAKHRVSTPVNWQQGDKVIIAGSVSNDEANEIWPDGWESLKPYIRIVLQPS